MNLTIYPEYTRPRFKTGSPRHINKRLRQNSRRNLQIRKFQFLETECSLKSPTSEFAYFIRTLRRQMQIDMQHFCRVSEKYLELAPNRQATGKFFFFFFFRWRLLYFPLLLFSNMPFSLHVDTFKRNITCIDVSFYKKLVFLSYLGVGS